MITEDQLQITYVEFGHGSSGDTYNIDRYARFFNESTRQLEFIRWISCSNPRCNMNHANSKYVNRGYRIENLVSTVIRTGEPIHEEHISCNGREGRGGQLCDNYIEISIEIKDTS